MSDYDQLLSAAGIPPPIPPQSISNVLSPGIISLFIQGLETGLVFSQFSQWLSLERKEGITITVLVLFVTTVGFVETAVCFTSAWRIYVRHYGQVILPGWTEFVHGMLSTLVAAPIQAYFIYRCYHIMKNTYIIIPLVATLISTVVAAGWVTAWIFRMHAAARISAHQPTGNQMVYYPFVVFLTLPAVLDITITSILLRSLIKFLKRIHAEHLRRRVVRYIVVTWQAVIPPCFCAVSLLILYLSFTYAHPGKPQMWYPAIQAMLGKLYILSLYFTLNNRMDLTNDPPVPVTYVTTVGADNMGSPTQRYVVTLPFAEQSEQGC
ncbi:hypothetical protein F5888DRAFT_605805 [Russula emetica]|nr:hypothetical protein F5888DRAFT_605805 [Russula emetica]